MSNGDKRKVSTDALETLGTIIGPNEKRDAIHLAVIPVKAGAPLRAGTFINSVDGVAKPDPRGLGIVDPFVEGPIEPGQMFWMVLRPRTITSLRHVWSHPDLPDEPTARPSDEVAILFQKADSEKWLREFCENGSAPGYEAAVAAAVEYINDGYDEEYLHFGTDASGSIPPEFWTHIEVVTGKKATHKATYFSCSC